MNTIANPTMYEAIPAVSELNRVPGFDPLKFLRKTDDGPKLDLKYKKLWFRLKHPAGRTKLTALRITEQLAIIEARVYFDKNDATPNGSYIATRYAQTTPGGLYIEAAQHEAMDAALNDAGFGVQFLAAEPKGTADATRPVVTEGATTTTTARQTPAADASKPAEPLATMKMNTPPSMESAPAAETPVSTPAPAAEVLAAAADEMPALPAQETEPNMMTEAPVSQAEQHIPVMQEEMSAPAPAPSETMVTEPTPPATLESFTTPAAPADAPAEMPAAFTPDMAVEDICAAMTLEEAGNVLVPVGTCKGWTLSQVADRRPASLKWYLNGYNGEDNTLRAGAKIMLEAIASMEKAS